MSVRCFVKASVGDKYDFFPLQVDSAFLKVANLKSKILERLTLAAADPPSRYDLAFQNGALLKDDEDCRNIRSDDILIFCPDGKSESFLCTSRENTGCTFFDICQLNSSKDKNTVQLDGENLTCENLVLIGMGDARVEISQSAISKIEKSRDVIEEAVKGKKPVYGVTTGFGCFKNKVVSKDQLSELQVNLITSHATGVGKPLSLMRTRMLLALRINVIVKGYSGVRMEIIKAMIAALNADCLPFIPEQGSVGASGDLAPLSHLALGLMGQGQMWSPKTGWGPAETVTEQITLFIDNLLSYDIGSGSEWFEEN
jgi:histidine ammonia-lyase